MGGLSSRGGPINLTMTVIWTQIHATRGNWFSAKYEDFWSIENFKKIEVAKLQKGTNGQKWIFIKKNSAFVLCICVSPKEFSDLYDLWKCWAQTKHASLPHIWNPVFHLQKHKNNKINLIGKQSTIIYQQKCWNDIRLGNWVSLLSICNILFWCKLWFISCIPTSIILKKINVFMVFMVFILFEFNFMC